MRIILVLLLFYQSSGQSVDDQGLEDNRRIVGGEESPLLPFMVWLVLKTSTKTNNCGASLLSPTSAVTAAHCLYEAKEITAYFGTKKKREGLQRKISVWQWYPKFDRSSYIHDIGVILWKEKITWTKDIKPIPIGSHPNEGTQAVIAGFGHTAYNKPTELLRTLKVTIKDNGICKKKTKGVETFFKNSAPNSYICVDIHPYKGSCGGDSGGPVFSNKGEPTLIGIISQGPPKCDSGINIYTSVSFYKKWIQDVTGCLERSAPNKCVLT